MSLSDFAREMPKVELHVHLEGSISPATLLILADRNGVALPAADIEGLKEFYRFTDFEHFLRVYFAISGCLRTLDDFELIAFEFGAEMARQNIRYAEVTFTPHTNVTNTGLPFNDILAALNAGRSRAEQEYNVMYRWVLDIVRDDPASRHQVAEWAIGVRDGSVIGFGLGGTEDGHPPEWFADAYAVARRAGLHSVPHAGETCGPESVWGAIQQLGAERIGHGVRSVEDPALINYLQEHQIPLEVCPTSNLCLGVYPSLEEHPIRWLWDHGVYVTLNSDDPPMFNTNLTGEYEAVVEHLGFDADDLERLSLNALEASFLQDAAKSALRQEFQIEFARLRAWELAGDAQQ